MPLYEYVALDREAGCTVCSRGFELRRPITRAPLECCPLCQAPVKKLVSRGVALPKVAKPFSSTEAKDAGFTVLEKRDEGVYEKL